MEVTVEDLPETPAESPQAAARSDFMHMAIAQRFDITSPTKEEDKQLSEIWAWAQGMAKSENIPDIVWEVIHLENVLGSPRIGEARLDRVYRYVKLKRQEAQIQQELRDVQSPSRIHQW